MGLFPKIILGILGKYFYSLPLIKLVGLDSTYLPPPHLPTNIAHSFPTQLEFTIYLHDIYWNKIFNVGLEYNGIKPRSHRINFTRVLGSSHGSGRDLFGVIDL